MFNFHHTTRWANFWSHVRVILYTNQSQRLTYPYPKGRWMIKNISPMYDVLVNIICYLAWVKMFCFNFMSVSPDLFIFFSVLWLLVEYLLGKVRSFQCQMKVVCILGNVALTWHPLLGLKLQTRILAEWLYMDKIFHIPNIFRKRYSTVHKCSFGRGG